MRNKCCVPNCDSRRKEVKMHRFSTREEADLEWLKCINSFKPLSLKNQDIKKMFVCHKHFEKRFVNRSKRLRHDAIPTLFTDTEISSGVPSLLFPCTESFKPDHSYYSNSRHEDHTYSRLKQDEGKKKIFKDFMASQNKEQEVPMENVPTGSLVTTQNKENLNKEDDISLESDDSGDEAILYLTQVDENDPDEDNLVYLNQIHSNQPTNEDSHIPYLQEITNNVPNKDDNIGSLSEVDSTVVIENGNMVYLPEVDHTAAIENGSMDYLPEVDDTAAIENGNMDYFSEVDENDPDEDSHIPHLQEVNYIPNKDGNIGSIPEVDGTAVIEDDNFFYSAETYHNKVTEEVILENKDFDMSHVSSMCRTCLCIMDDNRVHLENEVLLKQPTKLTEMLVSLGCVMDFGDDNWPKYICAECTKSLVSAYNFKMTCLSSTQTLLHEFTTIRSQHTEKNNTTGTNNEEYQPVVVQIVVQDSDCNESYEPEKMDTEEKTDMDDNCIVNEEYLISEEVRESIRCIKKDCDKKFAKVKSLIHHLAQYHPDERSSFCEKCSIGCASEKRLKECFIKRLKSPLSLDSRLKENRLSGIYSKCKGCEQRFKFNTPKSRNSLQPN